MKTRYLTISFWAALGRSCGAKWVQVGPKLGPSQGSGPCWPTWAHVVDMWAWNIETGRCGTYMQNGQKNLASLDGATPRLALSTFKRADFSFFPSDSYLCDSGVRAMKRSLVLLPRCLCPKNRKVPTILNKYIMQYCEKLQTYLRGIPPMITPKNHPRTRINSK